MTDDALDKTYESGGEKPADALVAGAQLGKYKLERVLGSGGMGVVWCAHDPDLERKVAIKVLRRADAGPALRTRLLREARAMARLKHPNVLTVYEVGSDGDRDFIAMELVDGTSLDQWIAARPPFDEVWAAILAAGRGLAAAHAAGLVHRDFKPHNVLRSRDGRILVTDFGLARGAGEEAGAPVAIDPKQVALDQTITPRHSDNVLDSTLTQPGQLIGTPAYMAPEQFDGAAPDPRTDQFAYCVTAWQALTGERPFDGRTIDELRKAARGGVAGVRAKLPRGVRAVLARGLSADHEQRWPDLEALLDALERDKRRRLIRSAIVWSVCGTILVGGAIVGIQVALHHPAPPAPPPKQANGCVPPDEAFAEVWTPARRNAIAKRLGSGAAFDHTAEAFDKLRTEWTDAYGKACAASGTAAMARLTCLLGERDELETYARLLETIPASAFGHGADLWGMLPRVSACLVESPVSPPLLPEDRKQRDNIVALRAQIMTMRMSAPQKLVKDIDNLIGKAKWLGWAPLEAEIEMSVGIAAQITDDAASARMHLEKASDLAEQHHDYRTEAASRIALLEVELGATEHPTERGRAEKLVEQARAAVRRAGDDPLLSISIDMLEAQLAEGRGKLDDALSQYRDLIPDALAAKAWRQAALAQANSLRVSILSGGPTDEAWEAATENYDQLSRELGPGVNGLAAMIAEVKWRRGELEDAHVRADKIRHPLPAPGSIELSGTVRKADGTPAAGATVVAWHGELSGDAKRAYIRDDFEGEVATADSNGAFTLHAPEDGAVIAELAGERSQPVKVAAGKQLALAPVRTISGHVTATGPETGGIDVAVRFELAPGLAWEVATARQPDGKYTLGGVPAGGVLVAERDGHTLVAGARTDFTWPTGATLEVLVRGKGNSDVYVLRGRRDVRSRAQLLALAKAETDLVVMPARPIGLASATEIGPNQYRPGDLQIVVREYATGDITACALPADDTAQVFCGHGTVPANGQLTMAIEQK